MYLTPFSDWKCFYLYLDNYVSMREEIEKALLRLKIEGKETRKEKGRNILIIIIVAVLLYLILHFYPQLNQLWIIEILIVGLGGVYIIFEAIPTLYQPLKEEFYAFKKIALAIEMLEKSNEPIAYEEAYRCVKRAQGMLGKIDLAELDWYEKINQTINQFRENLQSIVLPTIAKSSMKKEHLEEIALALYSMNPAEIEAVNDTLDAESTYTRIPSPPTKIKIFVRRLQQSTVRHILIIVGCGFAGFLAFHIGFNYLDVPLGDAYIAGFGLAGVLVAAYLNYIRK